MSGLDLTEFAFTEREARFLCQVRMGRLATVSSRGEPHVVPVAYEFDGRYIYFGGRRLSRTLKYRHISANPSVAFVVDDVVSLSPWRARGLEVRGTAEILQERRVPYVRITPESKVSWGL